MKTMRSGVLLLAALSLSTTALAPVAVYANTLTGLMPDLYSGMNIVSRELVGFIPSAARSSTAERAAVGQSTKFHKTRAITGQDIAPAMQVPEPRDVTVDNDSITITKSRAFEFGFVGEEQRGLNANGPGAPSVQADLFAQALRGLVNEVETDLANTAALGASRAYGTSGTAPFASGVGDSAQIRKILDDNGAPATGRSVVGSTSMGANLRTNTQLTKANEAGNVMTLRDGELINLHGMSFKESGQARQHTKGTMASATTNNAGYAIGATVITLASAGTGTLVAGDVIEFAGDSNKYVLAAGDADVSNGGTITLQAPGLRKAIPASTTNITINASYTASVAFSQDALWLAIRPPALPDGDDAAIDSTMIVDQRSGLIVEVRVYAGYRKKRYEVAMAWGTKAANSAHMALLLG